MLRLKLRMLSFAMGVTKMDMIRNKYIKGTAGIERIGKLKIEGEEAKVID